MAAVARTTKTYRLDDRMLEKLAALAVKDNRTENNLLETILLWAVERPELLKEIKGARKPLTLGALMGEVDEMRRALVVGGSADEQVVVGCQAGDAGAVVGGGADERKVVSCLASEAVHDAGSLQPDNGQPTTDN